MSSMLPVSLLLCMLLMVSCFIVGYIAAIVVCVAVCVDNTGIDGCVVADDVVVGGVGCWVGVYITDVTYCDSGVVVVYAFFCVRVRACVCARVHVCVCVW